MCRVTAVTVSFAVFGWGAHYHNPPSDQVFHYPFVLSVLMTGNQMDVDKSSRRVTTLSVLPHIHTHTHIYRVTHKGFASHSHCFTFLKVQQSKRWRKNNSLVWNHLSNQCPIKTWENPFIFLFDSQDVWGSGCVCVCVVRLLSFSKTLFIDWLDHSSTFLPIRFQEAWSPPLSVANGHFGFGREKKINSA